ncbi:hypothetical protein [Escherichia coli]|uniref:hypothetical protein n=1 Tax=Escherichia coli TaxID=562 RepID=UPI003D787F3D
MRRGQRYRLVFQFPIRQGMGGVAGIGSTTEKHQGRVAEAIFANCAELDNDQLNEIIEWVRLYQR